MTAFTLFRRMACAALAALALAAPAALAQPPAASPSAAAFIRDLGQAAATIVADPGRDPAARKAALAGLLADDIDVPAIGKFALGRYWRTASPEQQQAYLDVFGRYLVSIYAGRLEGEAGSGLEVLGSDPDGEVTVVHSRVLRSGGNPPLKLDWRVVRAGAGYKIVDVLVQDVSLAITQRSDFTGAIEHGQGGLQALIEALKSKVQAG